MRLSQLYAPTLRETPAEAEVISHQLMLRAGMLRKAAGGFYTYMPLAWRVLRKIEAIVREEMDAIEGQELLMPIVQPAELWQESGRWDVYGKELFRLKDRHDRDFCLGPTHEEMITTLVRPDIRSYRQMPLRLYQIQNKFRDERRPRFGLMRGREFIMKDMYSFDVDEKALDVSYHLVYDAYNKIFSRCGLNFRPVEADSGAIGGSGSHEFMAFAESGEAEVVYCSSCDYAANTEKADMAPLTMPKEDPKPLELVDTPNQKTIEELTAFLKIPVEKTIKAVAYQTEKGVVIALVRGDHNANDVKIQNKINCLEIEMADEEAITSIGSLPGFIGPVGLDGNVTVIADNTVMNMYNAVCGGNQADKHYVHVNPQRDFKPDFVTDIRLIDNGDPCPLCGKPVIKARGIEVGQVFKLHTKYSEAMHANFLDEKGNELPIVMGCYGIGVSRTMAAMLEQSYDEHGIIWPVAIAPYHVVVVPIDINDAAQKEMAEKIYSTLNDAGIEAVIDDRDERAGVKFIDADLIGYPLRITIGAKAVKDNKLEVKARRDDEVKMLSADDYVADIKTWLAKL